MRYGSIGGRTLLAGFLLGSALFVTTGPTVSQAEAGPRYQARCDYKGVCYRKGKRHRDCRRAYHRPAYRWRSCAPLPWYYSARRTWYDGRPYYFHAGLGVYFGGVALRIELGNRAPAGYAYYDPTCGETFYSVREYRRHRRHHNHRPVLLAVQVDEYDDHGYDDDYDDGRRGRRGGGRRGE